MAGAFHLVDHPLIAHKLSVLRDKTTPHFIFRDVINEVAGLLCYEICRDLPLQKTTVETPLETTEAWKLGEKSVIFASILRAGNGLLHGMLAMVPTASVVHIGVFRDPLTLEAQEYYFKAPPHMGEAEVIVVDPMLATGHSAIAALSRLKIHGARKLRFVALVAAPEGLEALHKAHPDVGVWSAALDRQLNEKAYILPGLGDAGDRIYGTV